MIKVLKITNDIVSFEQLGPDLSLCCQSDGTLNHWLATIVHREY